ncbi:MAG: hypothetical protein LBO08_03645 [Rickettsiales bacterium]|jgi:hypothetical protein|nr:hypothetical protein [Rickettsiales bacterium]
MKKIIVISAMLAVSALVAHRAIIIVSEQNRVVFNVARSGFRPVQTIAVVKENGIIKEPVFIKGNSAAVSCARAGRFKAGQHVGAGRIAAVSRNIDIDSGMCGLRTVGAADGDQFAELEFTGFFIPVSAIKKDAVFINDSGTAVQRAVRVIASDSETAVVTGLNDGDAVVLSNVSDGEKIK